MKKKMFSVALAFLLLVCVTHNSYGQNVTLRQLMNYEQHRLDKGTATACWLLFPCAGLAYAGSKRYRHLRSLGFWADRWYRGTKSPGTVEIEAVGLAIVRILS